MILGILDRILFSLGVILFLQLPAYIDQYTHRLGGFQRGFSEQINSFQTIADNNFDGDINQLINNFKQNQMPSIRETAETIEYNVSMNQSIQTDLDALQNRTLTQKIFYLLRHLRLALAKDTLNTFSPSIPLNIMSFVYGLLGGILFSSLFYLLIRLPLHWFNNKRNTVKHDEAKTQQI